MNTSPVSTLLPEPGAVTTGHSAGTALMIHAREAVSEWRRAWRTPMFVLPSLLFPAMFYLFFGILFNRGPGAAAYLLTSYATFGVIGPALFGFGVSVAIDREHGLLALKRVVPMPLSAYFSAKIIMSLIFATLIIGILYSLAYTLGEVRLPISQWLGLTLVLTTGILPFCALGLAIGINVNAQAAPAVVNLVYLPMSFLSGLWIPVTMLPQWLQGLAWILPPYHLSQLTLKVIGQSQGHPAWQHIAALAVFTLVFLLLAGRGYRRISDR
ncbi:MAG: ABC transporter permease [Wenzhouxiangellaceae bacterium]